MELEFFYDFVSPYSYLASTRVEAIGARNAVAVRFRPFLLGGVFKATGNRAPHEVAAKGAHMWVDLARWAHRLGVPCATGIKHLEVDAEGARARREYRGSEEVFDIPLPAVISVKEGINLPRYPSLPGRLRAKRAAIETLRPPWSAEGLRKDGLRVPAQEHKQAQLLGSGAEAAPALLRLLDELGVLP